LQGGGSKTLLKQFVATNTSFWNQRASFYANKPTFQDLGLSQQDCRACLKVMLYTSLNGGNPFSTDRILSNLANVKPKLALKVDSSKLPFESFSEYSAFINTFGTDELVLEVKELNQKCVDDTGKRVFTIDPTLSYPLDSQHKGI
jgi:hypothetical protein